jgi:hypothetical protein
VKGPETNRMKPYKYTPKTSQYFSELTQGWISGVYTAWPASEYPYIRTFSGKEFQHLLPAPSEICLEDIAHSLSRLCRFTGHVVPSIYSVAEHAVRVSMVCDPKDAFYGLHHDDTEAYCSDISRPFERLPGMEGYRLYEKGVMRAIAIKFNLPDEEPESVKKADLVLLATEQRDIMPLKMVESGDGSKWPAEPLPEKIKAWSQKKAERKFLERHYELGGK